VRDAGIDDVLVLDWSLIVLDFISKCQTVDAGQQLNDGIRFLDVRVKINDGDLQSELE
jgi:hypothetical protein